MVCRYYILSYQSTILGHLGVLYLAKLQILLQWITLHKHFCLKVYLQSNFQKQYAYACVVSLDRQIPFHKSCGNLDSTRNVRLFSQSFTNNILSSFWVFANLMGEKWYLIAALICISPLSEVKNLSYLRTILCLFVILILL